MKKYTWNVIHECDDENGNPTQWAAEINDSRYGKYCWINDISSGANKTFNVEVDCNGFVELVQCKSLSNAKQWVETHLGK